MANRLANGLDTVVTACAVARDRIVIEVGRCKRECRMAVVAGIAAHDMHGRLSDGRHVIVTADATSEHLGVIYRRYGRETDHRVAVLTGTRRQCMILRPADRLETVVTARAITGDAIVIEISRQPAKSRMTVVATLTARNMILRLADYRGVIVAVRALAQHLVVVDRSDNSESRSGMTVLAKARRRDVIEAPPRGSDTIVTARAT